MGTVCRQHPAGQPASVCVPPRAAAVTPAAHRSRAKQQRHQQQARWHLWHKQQQQGQRHREMALAALPPGLDAFTDAAGSGAAPSLLAGLQLALQRHAALYVLEALLAGVGAYAAVVWPSRPRGWVFKELVTAAPSRVAGMGVFATVHIQAGTVLGAYPGRPRGPAEMTAKCAGAPGARDYCFKTRDGWLLDPTDERGQLSASPAPGLPWLPIDFTLAYVNEPPRGVGGTNVTVEDDPSDSTGLLCVAARDILPGEELFMDYGPTYDRSRYGQADAGADGPAGAEGQPAGQAGRATPPR